MTEDFLQAPSSPDAERRVVGALLLQPSLIPAAMSKLQPDDFHMPGYRLIYASLCDLSLDQGPVSPSTVGAKLASQKMGFESALTVVGGTAGIGACMEGSDPEECDFWLAEVRRCRDLRALYDVALEARKLAASPESDAGKAFERVEDLLIRAYRPDGDRRGFDAEDVAADLHDRIRKYIEDPDAITGLETGWRAFDRKLDGFQPGTVTGIYAATSRFKSMLAQNVGKRFANRGIPGLWFTTEMPRVQVQERLVQLEAGVNLRWLRQDHAVYSKRAEIERANRAVGRLPITYFDRMPLDISTVESEVMRYVRWRDIQYVILDLIDHVSSSRYKDNQVGNESVVQERVKALAMRANIPIIFTTHVAKQEKHMRNQAVIDVEEMKGSSSKYQDSDVSISLAVVDPSREVTSGWRGLSRDEIKLRMQNRQNLNLMVAINKNRAGELADIPFEINLREGGRMQPLAEMSWQQQHLHIVGGAT